MDALKALVEGALRQMSVPGGAERVKGGTVVVVVLTIVADRISIVVAWRMDVIEGVIEDAGIGCSIYIKWMGARHVANGLQLSSSLDTI